MKYFVNGQPVPREQENFVRPVLKQTNLKQGGTQETQILYELDSDTKVLQTFLSFGGLR
jgi:hypothetical protein